MKETLRGSLEAAEIGQDELNEDSPPYSAQCERKSRPWSGTYNVAAAMCWPELQGALRNVLAEAHTQVPEDHVSVTS